MMPLAVLAALPTNLEPPTPPKPPHSVSQSLRLSVSCAPYHPPMAPPTPAKTTPRISIIDYGIGNLLSVRRAFEDQGRDQGASGGVELVDSAQGVLAAERLVLPGVGAFADGMAGLKMRGLIEPIREFAAEASRGTRAFLGICLGMQMMFDSSSEFSETGHHEGLGLIPGRVVAIPSTGLDGAPHKIPHIGWSSLVVPPARARLASTSPRDPGADPWQGTILEGVPNGEEMYFVHSFTAFPADETDRLADCHYDGLVISAAVGRGHLYGAQFHPEKSAAMGRRIIRNFMQIKLLERGLPRSTGAGQSRAEAAGAGVGAA